MNKLIPAIIAAFILTSCSHPEEQLNLITVTGEIPVNEMGTTLIHEHVMVDFIGADSTGYHRWDKEEVVERAMPFLLDLKEKGVTTFFECTPAYVGRDPFILKELSEKTGLNIITNTGYYGANKDKYIPAHAKEQSAEELAKLWINEFNEGIDGSNVRPGFIKIAVDRDDVLSPMHEKIITAAALAHKSTGLTIVSHTGTDGPAFAQIEVLKKQGVSPEVFVWTHAQGGTMEGYLKAAQEGAWISLDNVRNTESNNPDKPNRIDWYVETLNQLKKEGVLENVLISHDSGWYNVGQENGGNYRGYTDIFEYLIPALKENEFTQDDIDQLLVKNPKRAYGVKVRLLDANLAFN